MLYLRLIPEGRLRVITDDMGGFLIVDDGGVVHTAPFTSEASAMRAMGNEQARRDACVLVGK